MGTVSRCAWLEITPGCCHKGPKLCGYYPCLAFGSGDYEAVVSADKLPDVGETALPGLPPCRQAAWPCSDCAVITSRVREGVGIHFRGQGRERISPCTV